MVCGDVETDPESQDTVVNPTLVAEVLSPGTLEYDLGEKFQHYRQIPSLRAVVYVRQDRRQLEIRERADDGGWQTMTAGPGDAVVILEPGCTIDVARLYVEAGAPG